MFIYFCIRSFNFYYKFRFLRICSCNIHIRCVISGSIEYKNHLFKMNTEGTIYSSAATIWMLTGVLFYQRYTKSR